MSGIKVDPRSAIGKHTMVFAGHRQDKKYYQVWYDLVDGELSKSQRLFDKITKQPLVGGIYEFSVHEKDGDHLTLGYGGRFVGTYDDEELRKEWQLNERLADIQKEARKEFLPDETLRPLREAYRKMFPARRAAFIAWLILSMQKSEF